MEATHDGGRSLLPDPQHRSFLTNIHTFLSVYFSDSHNFPIIWLATFVSIVFCLEFVCTSSPHTYATLPDPLHPRAPCDPSRWRPFGVQLFAACGCDKVLVFNSLLASVWLFFLRRTSAAPFVRINLVCFAYLADGRP